MTVLLVVDEFDWVVVHCWWLIIVMVVQCWWQVGDGSSIINIDSVDLFLPCCCLLCCCSGLPCWYSLPCCDCRLRVVVPAANDIVFNEVHMAGTEQFVSVIVP